jgi:hypothetical protein
MPKAKKIEKKVAAPKEEEKIIEIDTEEKELDAEIMPGEETEEELEDDAILDDDEVDPFKDKWEE